jgi:hypothetical protein
MTPHAPFDAERPNIARVYDYLLGGSHNFEADRIAAAEFIARWPEAPQTMRMKRVFLGRTIRYLAQSSIHQFLDIGSGIPTMGNVHEVRQYAPGARGVYADNDEVAVLHSRAILAGHDDAVAIQADLRVPAHILSHPELRATLELSQPVALLLVAVLHFLPDTDDPASVVKRLRHPLASGSYLLVSHGPNDCQDQGVAEAVGPYSQTTAPFQPRSDAGVAAFFDAFALADLGLVRVSQWWPDQAEHPGGASGQIAAYGGAGCRQ